MRTSLFMFAGFVATLLFAVPQIQKLRAADVEYSVERVKEQFIFSAQPIQIFAGEKSTAELNVTSTYLESVSRDGSAPVHNWTGPFHVIQSGFLINTGLHSASKASPAVDASGIYVGSDSGWFFAFDHQFKLKWKIYFADSNRGIHSTAVLTDQFVYIGTYNGMLYCLNKETGKIQWSKRVGHAIGSSPVIYKNSLYVGVETTHPNGYLIKVDAITGKTQWHSDWFGNQPHSSPAIDTAKNIIVIGANSAFVFGIDMITGKTLWKFESEGEVKSTPVIYEDRAYVTSWGGKVFALDVVTGKSAWESLLSIRSQSSVALDKENRRLIVVDQAGHTIGLDLKSGNKQWEQKFNFESLLTSPVFFKWQGTAAFLMLCKPKFLCVLSSANGNILKTIEISAYVTSVPKFFSGEVFISPNYPGDLFKLSPTVRGANP